MVWPASVSHMNILRRSQAIDLLSCGSTLVDVISHVKKLPSNDNVSFVSKKSPQKAVVRGGAINSLAWVQVLGVNSAVMCLQGADKYGDLIRETMRKHDICTDFFVQKEEFETSTCRTYISTLGEQSSVMTGGSMQELPAKTMTNFFSEPIQKAKFISTEIAQLPFSSVEEMMDIAINAGSLRFLDIVLSPSVAIDDAELGSLETLERCISKSTVVKASLESAKELTNDPNASMDEIAVRLREKFQVPFVAVTDGDNDSVIAFKLAGGKCRSVAVPLPSNLTVSDYNGADDAFFGGLIAGIHHWGLPDDIDSALRIGKLAGATKAVCLETIGSLPSEESFHRVQKYIPLSIQTHRKLSVDQPALVKALEGPNKSLSRDIDALLNMRRLFQNINYSMQFNEFVQRIVKCCEQKNRVYTTGIGKSGIVAKRFAATLSSLSIRAQWVHGSEWTHGDLGNLYPGDVVILMSNSGQTPELINLPHIFRGFDCDVMCLVGNEDSILYNESDYKIFTPAVDCLFGSVPTRSIVTQEAVCNAVAECVVTCSGIKQSTFKRNHPGGNIGRLSIK